jgi:hypothetical protein
MTAKRRRANGEGSIFPYRNGFAAYVWVTKPDGKRTRKYVYGKNRDEVHDKWITLQQRAREGPVPTRTPTLESYLNYWLREIVEPNLAPATHVSYEMFTRLYIVPDLGPKAARPTSTSRCPIMDQQRRQDLSVLPSAEGCTTSRQPETVLCGRRLLY